VPAVFRRGVDIAARSNILLRGDFSRGLNDFRRKRLADHRAGSLIRFNWPVSHTQVDNPGILAGTPII
jgi:hypothetical protein